MASKNFKKYFSANSSNTNCSFNYSSKFVVLFARKMITKLQSHFKISNISRFQDTKFDRKLLGLRDHISIKDGLLEVKRYDVNGYEIEDYHMTDLEVANLIIWGFLNWAGFMYISARQRVIIQTTRSKVFEFHNNTYTIVKSIKDSAQFLKPEYAIYNSNSDLIETIVDPSEPSYLKQYYHLVMEDFVFSESYTVDTTVHSASWTVTPEDLDDAWEVETVHITQVEETMRKEFNGAVEYSREMEDVEIEAPLFENQAPGLSQNMMKPAFIIPYNRELLDCYSSYETACSGRFPEFNVEYSSISRQQEPVFAVVEKHLKEKKVRFSPHVQLLQEKTLVRKHKRSIEEIRDFKLGILMRYSKNKRYDHASKNLKATFNNDKGECVRFMVKASYQDGLCYFRLFKLNKLSWSQLLMLINLGRDPDLATLSLVRASKSQFNKTVGFEIVNGIAHVINTTADKYYVAREFYSRLSSVELYHRVGRKMPPYVNSSNKSCLVASGFNKCLFTKRHDLMNHNYHLFIDRMDRDIKMVINSHYRDRVNISTAEVESYIKSQGAYQGKCYNDLEFLMKSKSEHIFYALPGHIDTEPFSVTTKNRSAKEMTHNAYRITGMTLYYLLRLDYKFLISDEELVVIKALKSEHLLQDPDVILGKYEALELVGAQNLESAKRVCSQRKEINPIAYRQKYLMDKKLLVDYYNNRTVRHLTISTRAYTTNPDFKKALFFLSPSTFHVKLVSICNQWKYKSHSDIIKEIDEYLIFINTKIIGIPTDLLSTLERRPDYIRTLKNGIVQWIVEIKYFYFGFPKSIYISTTKDPNTNSIQIRANVDEKAYSNEIEITRKYIGGSSGWLGGDTNIRNIQGTKRVKAWDMEEMALRAQDIAGWNRVFEDISLNDDQLNDIEQEIVVNINKRSIFLRKLRVLFYSFLISFIITPIYFLTLTGSFVGIYTGGVLFIVLGWILYGSYYTCMKFIKLILHIRMALRHLYNYQPKKSVILNGKARLVPNQANTLEFMVFMWKMYGFRKMFTVLYWAIMQLIPGSAYIQLFALIKTSNPLITVPLIILYITYLVSVFDILITLDLGTFRSFVSHMLILPDYLEAIFYHWLIIMIFMNGLSIASVPFVAKPFIFLMLTLLFYVNIKANLNKYKRPFVFLYQLDWKLFFMRLNLLLVGIILIQATVISVLVITLVQHFLKFLLKRIILVFLFALLLLMLIKIGQKLKFKLYIYFSFYGPGTDGLDIREAMELEQCILTLESMIETNKAAQRSIALMLQIEESRVCERLICDKGLNAVSYFTNYCFEYYSPLFIDNNTYSLKSSDLESSNVITESCNLNKEPPYYKKFVIPYSVRMTDFLFGLPTEYYDEIILVLDIFQLEELTRIRPRHIQVLTPYREFGTCEAIEVLYTPRKLHSFSFRDLSFDIRKECYRLKRSPLFNSRVYSKILKLIKLGSVIHLDRVTLKSLKDLYIQDTKEFINRLTHLVRYLETVVVNNADTKVVMFLDAAIDILKIFNTDFRTTLKPVWAPNFSSYEPWVHHTEISFKLNDDPKYVSRNYHDTLNHYIKSLNFAREMNIKPLTMTQYRRAVNTNPYVDTYLMKRKRIIMDRAQFTDGIDGITYATAELVDAATARYYEHSYAAAVTDERLDHVVDYIYEMNPETYAHLKLTHPMHILRKKNPKFSANVPFIPEYRKMRELKHTWFKAISKTVIDWIEKGEYPDQLYSVFPKSQVISKEKMDTTPEKLRTIMAQNVLSYTQNMVFTYDLNKRQRWDLNPIKIGMPLTGGAYQIIYEKIKNRKQFFSLDMKAFDANIPSKILQAAGRLIAKGYGDHPQHDLIKKHILTAYKSLEHGYTINLMGQGDSNVKQKMRGASTGGSDTSTLNSNSLQIAVIEALSTITKKPVKEFHRHHDLINFGDDNILATDLLADVDIDKLVKYMSQTYGLTLKVEEAGSIFQQQFLSKIFVPVDEIKDELTKYDIEIPKVGVKHNLDLLKMRHFGLKSEKAYRFRTYATTSLYMLEKIQGSMALCAHHPEMYEELSLEYDHYFKRLPKRIKKTPYFDAKYKKPTYKKVLEDFYKPPKRSVDKDLSFLQMHYGGLYYFDHSIESALVSFEKVLDKLPIQLFGDAELEANNTHTPYRTSTFDIESFIYLSYVHKNDGLIPTLSEFKSLCNTSPFKTATDPEYFYNHRATSLNLLHGTDLDLELVYYRRRMHLLSCVYYQTNRFINLFRSIPIVALPVYILQLKTFDLPRLYSFTNFLYWLENGESSALISQYIPKDLYANHKRAAAYMLSLIPKGLEKLMVTDNITKYTARLATAVTLFFNASFSNDAAAKNGSYNDINNKWNYEVDHIFQERLWDDKDRLVISSVTGSGKTFWLPQALINRYFNSKRNPSFTIKHVVILEPRNILVEQLGIKNVNRVNEHSNYDLSKQIHVMTYGYFQEHMMELIYPNTIYLFDEFHEADSTMLRPYLKLNGTAPILFTSATPKFDLINDKLPMYKTSFEPTFTVQHYQWFGISPEEAFHKVITELPEYQRKRVLIIEPSILRAKMIVNNLKNNNIPSKLVYAGDRYIPEKGHIVATQVVDAGINIDGITCVIDTGYRVISHRGGIYKTEIDVNTSIQRAGRTGRYCDGAYVILREVQHNFKIVNYPDIMRYLEAESKVIEHFKIPLKITPQIGNSILGYIKYNVKYQNHVKSLTLYQRIFAEFGKKDAIRIYDLVYKNITNSDTQYIIKYRDETMTPTDQLMDIIADNPFYVQTHEGIRLVAGLCFRAGAIDYAYYDQIDNTKPWDFHTLPIYNPNKQFKPNIEDFVL